MKKNTSKKIQKRKVKSVFYTRVPQEIAEAVKRLCEKTRLSQNIIVRDAIEFYLKNEGYSVPGR